MTLIQDMASEKREEEHSRNEVESKLRSEIRMDKGSFVCSLWAHRLAQEDTRVHTLCHSMSITIARNKCGRRNRTEQLIQHWTRNDPIDVDFHLIGRVWICSDTVYIIQVPAE